MVHLNPALRMSADDVVAHPFWWSSAKQLSFLLEASDRFESEPAHSELRLCLESQAAAVVGEQWHTSLHSGLMSDVTKYRTYDTSKVRDLLRIIRNKRNHYNDLPLEVRRELGSLPDGFLAYFRERFPALLIYVYSVLSCFAIESAASSAGDCYSYSPLDPDHSGDASAELQLETVLTLYDAPLSTLCTKRNLRFSSPQFEQFFAGISLRRLIQLQRHTRLRFRHWNVSEERWLRAGAVAAVDVDALNTPVTVDTPAATLTPLADNTG
jgi:hypothetical protein